MDQLLLGFSGLLLMAIWRFALRKGILDDHRDQLFDLRDELRAEFVAQGWALDSELYKRLRDLLNGYLKFTESYSFFEFIFMENQVRKDEGLQAAFKEGINAKFKTADPKQAEYVLKLRRRAVAVMMNYMIVSSGPLMIVTAIIVPFIALHLLVRSLFSVVHAGSNTIISTAGEILDVVFEVVQLAAAVLAKKLLLTDFVEKISYEQAA